MMGIALRSWMVGFALAMAPMVPAIAQGVSDRRDDAPPGSIDQISSAPPLILTAPRASRTSAPPPQLTDEPQSGLPAQQLTGEGRSVPAPSQIYKGKRTAQASTPLSQPSDGRTGSVAKVAGTDRCDPAIMKRLHMRECANVIENRAAEFERLDNTPLSPEQRIIVAQQIRERAGTATGAARLLANGTLNADSSDDQEVASIVLRPPSEPLKKEEPVDEPTAEEQAAAIVSAIIDQPPR